MIRIGKKMIAGPATVIATVCDLIADGDLVAAKALLTASYPHVGASTPRKAWPLRRLVAVFVRDGFTDRYFGARLVFPGTLRALSLLMPDAFPYHRNWKQDVTHRAFWELYPTIDHVVPAAHRGMDDESNDVTTSMLMNGAQSNWLLEKLAWPIERAPVAQEWHGLLAWFMAAWETHAVLRQNATLRRWHAAISI